MVPVFWSNWLLPKTSCLVTPLIPSMRLVPLLIMTDGLNCGISPVKMQLYMFIWLALRAFPVPEEVLESNVQ